MAQDRPLQDTQDTVRIPLYGEDAKQSKATVPLAATNGQMFYNCFPCVYHDPTGGHPEKWIESRAGLSNDISVNLSTIMSDHTTANPVAAITMVALTDVTIVAMYEDSTDDLYIIQYRPLANTVELIGTIPNVGADYSLTPFSAPTVAITEVTHAGLPAIAISIWAQTHNASNGYYAISDAGTKLFPAASLTIMADADFPPNLATPVMIVGPFVQMNGTLYIMGRNGSIYNSDLNTITAWNALGVKVAQTSPDRGMGLVRYKHHIVAMGVDTIEFFYDAGIAAPASPLARQDQAYIKMGVVSPLSYLNIRDTLYYVSRDINNNIALWKLEQYTPVMVSQPGVNYMLSVGNVPQLVCMSFNGMQNIIINGTNRTLSWPIHGNMHADDGHPTSTHPSGLLAYNINSNAWWYLNIDSRAADWTLQAIYPVAMMTAYAAAQSMAWIGVNAGGSIYSAYPMQTDLYNDTIVAYDTLYNGVERQYKKIPVFFSTNTLDFGNEKRKRVHKYKIIGTQYRSNGLATAPTTTWAAEDNYMYLYWSNKDPIVSGIGVFTASDVKVRSADVSPTTYTIHRYYCSNLGSGRYWTFGMFMYTYLPIRFRYIELDVSQGTS
jgi:hypothetical protein